MPKRKSGQAPTHRPEQGRQRRAVKTTPGSDRGARQGNAQAMHRPSQGQWLYGTHPVLAALGNPRRRCHRLILTAEAEQSLAGRLASLLSDKPGLRAERLGRAEIDQLLPGSIHQGIALQVEPLEEPDLGDVLRETAGHTDAVLLVLDQVTDPHNVGAILRSAAAFRVCAVILTERHAPGASAVLAKAASGALERVPLVRVTNLVQAMEEIKKAGFWCAGLDADAETDIAAARLDGKVALVLGAEGRGMRRLTREHCDLLVRIPMTPDGVSSLNVSNAAAVALYELFRTASPKRTEAAS